ncbi:SDR family NAD(P)-dependent oxidoreductase [Armatimonas sp.]|uniref:SDR family NAD(P)-dependent oxidoreductase n=1 Tax=Armatimonas sp. TaxID=1872638 RepID=UPI0037503C64
MRLQGKSAIVTGAAQGLGEALAQRLASEGCSVLLADMSEEKAIAAAVKIGASAIGMRADVTSASDCAAMVACAVAEFGKLDILIANAGILIAGDVCEFDPEKWRKVIDVNLSGYFISAQAACKQMALQKSGCIVQINSKSGKKGSRRNSAYAASKFGGIGLTQSLALDMAPHGVRVNCVCPGNLLDGTLWQDSLFGQYSQTQALTKEQVREKYESQVPLGRSATYTDIAGVVVFLCTEDAGYMTGQALNVTGGQEMR